MNSKNKSIWVGKWKERRLVVFDPKGQPDNIEFMLLYFVQGQSLCIRNRAIERNNVIKCQILGDYEFAVEQYQLWLSLNKQSLETKKYQTNFVVEEPEVPRRKCSSCDGDGNFNYRVGTFSDGSHSDGQNFTDHCNKCHGSGYVDNVL